MGRQKVLALQKRRIGVGLAGGGSEEGPVGPPPGVTWPLDLGVGSQHRAARSGLCLATDQDAGVDDIFGRVGRLPERLEAHDVGRLGSRTGSRWDQGPWTGLRTAFGTAESNNRDRASPRVIAEEPAGGTHGAQRVLVGEQGRMAGHFGPVDLGTGGSEGRIT